MFYIFEFFGLETNGWLYDLAMKYFEKHGDAEVTAFSPNLILFAVFFALGLALVALAAYLLGSFNFAVILSKKMFGDDIRRHGSGNAGMTNMLRTYGVKAGILTLLGDMVKMIAAFAFGVLIFGRIGAYVSGIFCIIGHIKPAYFGRRGGKGVATTAMMVLLLDPAIFLMLIAVFLLVLFTTRYVSLSSIFAAFTYPAFIYLRALLVRESMPLLEEIIFSCFIALLILFTHRENIKRLWNGEENKFTFKKSAKAVSEEEAEEDAGESFYFLGSDKKDDVDLSKGEYTVDITVKHENEEE